MKNALSSRAPLEYSSLAIPRGIAATTRTRVLHHGGMMHYVYFSAAVPKNSLYRKRGIKEESRSAGELKLFRIPLVVLL
jgi:hypothetical protein